MRVRLILITFLCGCILSLTTLGQQAPKKIGSYPTRDSLSQFVDPDLRDQSYAFNLAKFLVGHIEKNFDLVVNTSFAFQHLLQNLNASLPPKIATSRYLTAIEEGKKLFMEEKGPYEVSLGYPLPVYFPPTDSTFKIVHLTTTQNPIGGTITKVFVEVEFLTAKWSPYEKSFNPLETSLRKMKKIMLVFPMKEGLVFSDRFMNEEISLFSDPSVTQYW